MALIAKSEDAKSIEAFRPISLCNAIYKIISKVAANRLKNVIQHIISDEQKAFIRGRQLIDGAIQIHELIHSLCSNKSKGLLLKLDMKKAFDRVNWQFLQCTMGKLGFNDGWIQWIFALIGNPSFSIIINGSAQGFFNGSRGLRQGDPLSPYLFIIVAKALGRGIWHLQLIEQIKVLHINQQCPSMTHSQFANDTLLAAYPSIHEIRKIKCLLKLCETASGQAINTTKSKLYGINLPPNLLQ